MSKQTHDDVEKLSLLRRRYGDEIVDQLIAQAVLGKAPLAAEAGRVAEELLAWTPTEMSAVRAPLVEVERIQPDQLLSEPLPAPLEGLGVTAAKEGPAFVPRANDPVWDAFDALARRAYVALLAASNPRNADGRWHPLRLRATEEHRAAAEATRGDAAFRPLWEAEEIITSFGRTKNWIHLYDPVELFVHGAWRLCLLRGSWSIEALRAAIGEQLDRLRNAKQGIETTCPVFLGFGAARIAASTSRGFLHVRPYRGNLQSHVVGDRDRLDAHGGGFVVERTLPWKYRTRIANAPPDTATAAPEGRISEQEWSSFKRWEESLAVAIAMASLPTRVRPHNLAQPAAVTRAPQLRWAFSADPIYGARSLHFSQGWPGDECPEISISKEVLERAEQLAEIDDPATRVAIDRLGRALEQPRAWKDALLDAVIAWEALSGEGVGAVVVQVTAVVAHLISEPTHRKQVRAELRKVYHTRSRVVHGGLAAPAQADRDAAVLAGVVGLRALLDEHPTLIGYPDRFDRLCLDSI